MVEPRSMLDRMSALISAGVGAVGAAGGASGFDMAAATLDLACPSRVEPWRLIDTPPVRTLHRRDLAAIGRAARPRRPEGRRYKGVP